MFDAFKLYIRKEISLDDAVKKIAELGYSRQGDTQNEGDFSLKGDTLEIFPVNFNYPLRVEWEFNAVAKIYGFDKLTNRRLVDYEFLIVIPHFKKSHKYKSEDLPLDAVLKLKNSDYVVHSRYGVARFLGMKKMVLNGTEELYFELEYRDGDKMYVSKEEAHLVQKYISLAGRPPKLTKLGTKEWSRIKAKVEEGIKAYALTFLRMEAQRKLIGGVKYSPDGELQKAFEATFPFKETEDQISSTNDVKRDMEAGKAMDRIICGDVGYGKTEVAMRAAVKVVADSKQVAFLVPTTVLAYQHYLNLSKRLKDFPVRVEMLSRFRTHQEQAIVVKELGAGKVDIIVGTHRLLSKDIIFKDLGLLIIDEEHRFGVEHKEVIKKMKVGINVLTLTATPIPRTLYMGLTGIKDISLMKNPPPDRLAVKTKLIDFSPDLLAKIITDEVARGGEIFVVNNRIESIFSLADKLKKVLPEKVKMGVIHGRLPPKAIENAMRDFIDKKINCLVSTAIVESGIDITSANTIIINNAHTFGLADLHQLRGRVGRREVQAFAYLVVPKRSIIPAEALKRLQLVEEFSHLGAGFEIAMSDLELRGAGNILGKEQHGFIWMVGFDLYCRLLKKEIEYLREAFKIEVGL
jgi:transcription-repair coupling factor (superfamily II helicase)